jgi:hypothetical protein
MLTHCTIKKICKGEVKQCQHCRIEECEPGARIVGNHNTFKNCSGFTGSGNHNYFDGCKDVIWDGNHCNVNATSSRMTITGNHTYLNGSNCLVMGSHTYDYGSNNTLEGVAEYSTRGSSVQARRVARADNSYLPAIGQDFSQRGNPHRPLRLGNMVFNQGFQGGSLVLDGMTITGNFYASGGDSDGEVRVTSGNGNDVTIVRNFGTVSGGVNDNNLPAVGRLDGNVVIVNRGPSPPAPNPSPPAPPPPPVIEYPEAPREPEPSTEDSEKQCALCMDREKSTVAIPCGCRYACVTCIRTSKPTACALCRTPLKGVYRVY